MKQKVNHQQENKWTCFAKGSVNGAKKGPASGPGSGPASRKKRYEETDQIPIFQKKFLVVE